MSVEDNDPEQTADLLPVEGKAAGRPLKFPSELADRHFADLDWGLGWCASPKMDGNRCLILNGVARTSSMRPFRNERVAAVLQPLLELSRAWDLFFDLEIYDRDGEHHAALSGALNAYSDPLPDSTSVCVFDGGRMDWFREQSIGTCFANRLDFLRTVLRPDPLTQIINDGDTNGAFVTYLVNHYPITSEEETRQLYDTMLKAGFEGLILRARSIAFDHRNAPVGGWYKHGRATARQQIGFKMKPFETMDGIITEVIQGRKLDQAKMLDHVTRSRNPDGTLSRTGLQDCYSPDDTVGAFKVTYLQSDGEHETEIGFARGWDHEARRKLWARRDELIDKWVEFSTMSYGAKEGGGARHGRLVRFRPDKDGTTLEGNRDG